VNDITAIIYLNRKWDVNWAGETILLNSKDDIGKAVMPKWGRVFAFSSCIRHAGRGVSRSCPEARTVLVFKARKKNDA
jgi:SM-20-related protein